VRRRTRAQDKQCDGGLHDRCELRWDTKMLAAEQPEDQRNQDDPNDDQHPIHVARGYVTRKPDRQ
jgi:hypothetical protein